MTVEVGPYPPAPFAESFSVLEFGERVGSLTVGYHEDVLELDYSVVNNGRGEKFTERLRVGAGLFPLEWSVTGTSLMGGAVDEELVTQALPGGGCEKQADLDAYVAAFEVLVDVLKLLHERGVPLWPGTDDGTGFTLHRELELYVAAGLDAAEVLRIVAIYGEFGIVPFLVPPALSGHEVAR
jgi:hypothetical protein